MTFSSFQDDLAPGEHVIEAERRYQSIIIGGVILALAGLALLWLAFGTNTTPVQTAQPVGFAVPEGPVREVPAVRMTVAASSFGPPNDQDGTTHGPDNLLDGDPATAWVSAPGSDQGRGETLTFRFTEIIDLQAIQFVNGYIDSEDRYRTNHRIRQMTVRTDSRAEPFVVLLLDIMESQDITADFGLTAKVEVEINDVFPASGAQAASGSGVALTEVSFLAVQR